MKKSKILVLGSNGLVGRTVKERLLKSEKVEEVDTEEQLKEEVKEVEVNAAEEVKEDVSKEVKEELSKPAADPIKHSPETGTGERPKGFIFSQNKSALSFIKSE